jgi:thioredoxin reductase (NADPH)
MEQEQISERIVMYGTNWCGDCRRAKRFLNEMRIPYDWVNIEQDARAMAYVEQVNHGSHSVPTIVFPDGAILVEPSNAELAEKLGIARTAQKDTYDVVIVGGGPAGLTAAIYCGRDGFETLVLEKSAPGGQAGVSQIMENFPGFDEGITGEEFARRMAKQAKRFGAEVLQAQEVAAIEIGNPLHIVHTASGDAISARALLLATGSRRRRLNVPGEAELIGVSVHFCATCDGAFYRDRDVLVVGGGDSGFEEGLFLTRFARRVTIVEFLPQVKASRILQEKVAARKDMRVVTNHAIKELIASPDGKLARVRVEDRATGKIEEWSADGLFVFVGLEPNSDFFPAEIERDDRGFVVTDERLQTSVPGIFSAGDVRAGSTGQAAAAAGEGATAAVMMRRYLQGD